MRRPVPKLALLFFAILLASAFPARAQNQNANTSRIGAITVVGTQKYPVDQIAAASGLKAGDVVTAKQIQEAADRLAALGVFSNVGFHYTTAPDGAIAMSFQVHDAPTYPLSFDNFPWFTDSELAKAIRDDVGLFAGEAPENGAFVDEIALVLSRLLAARNIKGSVTHQLLAQAVGDGMMMQFRVEGPVVKIQSVQFGDPLSTGSEPLKDRIPDIKGQPYSRLAIEIFESEHVRPIYEAKGFLHAQIGPPKATLSGGAGSDAPGGAAVDVLIPITPGLTYSWKGVSWQGNSAIASTNLNSGIELKPGDVADGIKIEAAWQKIQFEYTRHGYMDAKLDPQPQFDDAAHQASYRVSIAEGPQYHMGELVITGLSVDAEKRLRRVWLTSAGQVFDNGYYENIVKELLKPSSDIFGEIPVHYNQFGHLLRPDPDKHTVDVLMDFK